MNKITIIGDGITKDFYFTFPFFTKNDIIVEKNSEPATGYGIFCFQAGLNSDFPFVGGKVHFSKAPKSTDAITIMRKLELNRHIDYQPTVRLNPTTVNQDMNFIIEILKDMQNILGDFADQYSEITNKESTQTLLTKIANVTLKINDISEQIDALDGISTIIDDIDGLQDSVSSLDSNVDNITDSVSTIQNSISSINSTINTPNKWCYLPSCNYIDLNIQNGGTYVAPDNGYIWLQSGQTPNTQLYVDVQDSSGNLIYGDGAIMDYGCVFIPIAKGNTAVIKYTAKQFLRFVYAVDAN